MNPLKEKRKKQLEEEDKLLKPNHENKLSAPTVGKNGNTFPAKESQNTKNAASSTSQKLQSNPGASPFAMYKKRPGTNDSGKEYEYMMCALYAVKLATNDTVADFEITTNDQKYGDFDDISLNVSFINGTTKHFLLQLKHLEDTKKSITDTDFSSLGSKISMVKYLKSYEEIDAGDASVILYTNRQTKMRKGFEFLLKPEENSENFLKAGVKEYAAGEEDLLVNSRSKPSAVVFQFDLRGNEEKFTKIANFSKNFYFFAGQDNIRSVRSSLRQLLLSLLDQDVYDLFVSFIRKWWLGWFVLNKHDTIAKLAELALSPWIRHLSGANATTKTELLTKAMTKFEMTLLQSRDPLGVADIWAPEFDNQHLQTASRKYDVTLKDKSLWYLGKVPLVVTVEDENFQKIRAAANLLGTSIGNKKIVLLGDVARESFPNWGVFGNLQDLVHGSEEIYNEIVTTFRVSLQSRPPILLKQLITRNQEMLQSIETKDLLEMSQKECLVAGAKIEQDASSQWYIPRTVSRPILDTAKVLTDLTNTVLVVNCTETFKNSEFLKDVDVKELDQVLSSDAENLGKSVLLSITQNCSLSQFQQLAGYAGPKRLNVLLVQVEDAKYCTLLLRHELYESSLPKPERAFIKEAEIFNRCHNKLTVLCAPPGMGKTTLLQVLSGVYCPADFWAVHVSLIAHNPFLAKAPSTREILSRFLEPQTQIQKSLYDQGKLVLFLDGLDEVNAACVDLILDLVQYALKQGIYVWLSSRENLSGKMADRLHVVPINIEKLTRDEQEKYMHQRLKSKFEDSEIERIVATVFASTDVAKSQELLEIPLQLFIITELLLDNEDFYQKLTKENMFVLTKLYQIYFEGKKKFSFKKIGVDQQEEQIGYNFKHHLKQYEILGLKATLDEEDFNKFSVNIMKHEDFVNQVRKRGDKFGIIKSIDDNDVIIFNHQTYAEYFSCAWFRSHLNKVHILRVEFFASRYANLRMMFDIMMAENNPLHLAVIYKNMGQFQKHAAESHIRDTGGRSALHISCCYGSRLAQNIDFKKNFNRPQYESDDYKEIVDCLLSENLNVGEQDDTFRFNCLDYSIKSRCLYPLDKMVASGTVIFQDLVPALLQTFDAVTLAYYCAFLGYPHLLLEVVEKHNVNFNDKTFGDYGLLGVAVLGNREQNPSLPRKGNIAAVNILVNKGANLNLVHTHYNILDAACVSQCYDMLRLLAEDHGLQCTGGNTILHRVAEHGVLNKQVLDFQIPVDSKNDHGQTALLLASQHGKIENVSRLVELGADVNTVDDCGKTALHYATQKRNNSEMLKLLHSYGASAQDFKPTPLQIACEIACYINFKTLVDLGADINIVDDDHNTLLHHAARVPRNNEEIISSLIGKNFDVNAQNNEGSSPLHEASGRGQVQNVTKLLEADVDVTLLDNKQNNYLHRALYTTDAVPEMIKLLVELGIDINGKNGIGDTPLSAASRYAQTQNVKQLVDLGADVNIIDNHGNIPLHTLLRAWLQPTEIVSLLKDSNLNIPNKKGQFPLQIACEKGHVANVQKLLELGADVNYTDGEGNNYLHRFCLGLTENTEIINLFLKFGIEVNAQNKHGVTPLHISCKLDLKKNIKSLLQNGADPDVVDNRKYAPLHYLLQTYNEQHEMVELLSSHGVNFNCQNCKGEVPLHTAAGFGLVKTVKKMLQSGARSDIVDNNLNTVLHDAITTPQAKVEMLQSLISSGLDIDSRNINGLSPLYLSCRIPFVENVKKLLNLGADINTLDNDGRTLLHGAARASATNTEIIQILISLGLGVNSVDNNGTIPLHETLETNQTKNIEYLLNSGADVNIVDKNGNTAFHFAAKASTPNSNIVDFLVHCGLGADARNRNGTTPFHLATEKGLLINVKKFLEMGADVLAVDNDGNTAMHYAARAVRKNEEVMDLLTCCGLEVNSANKEGLVPLYFAHQKGQKDNMKKLIELGADKNVVGDHVVSGPSEGKDNPGIVSLLQSSFDIQIGSCPVLENLVNKKK